MSDVVLAPLDTSEANAVRLAHRIVTADEVAVLGFTEETLESFRERLAHPDLHEPANRLALRAGMGVGLLLVELDRHGREVFLDAYAACADRPKVQGILLEDGLSSARAIAEEDPAAGGPVTDPYTPSARIWQVMAGCFAKDTAYASVLQASGFRTIRHFWRMSCDLTGASDGHPEPPPGVTRRAVEGDADRRVMHRLFAESFAEHFGSTHDHPYEEWIASVEAIPGADPSRWWIASLDGVDVGVCLLDNSRAERLNASYVRTLGVVTGARGRGIGRWLLQCAAADAVAQGRSSIALTVDGQNTTSATGLYESVGYRTDEVIDVWCHPLPTTG